MQQKPLTRITLSAVIVLISVRQRQRQNIANRNMSVADTQNEIDQGDLKTQEPKLPRVSLDKEKVTVNVEICVGRYRTCSL